jgi:GMP synthase-like glutamine amidotransferase
VALALVIANRDDNDPGLIGDALAERGFEMVMHAREDQGPSPVAATAVDLVLLLGSEWSVYCDSVRASVEREQRVVTSAVDAAVPVLAICFGAQVLAAALGGTVTPAGRTEIGWLAVAPVGDSAIEPGPWFQFHSDTFTLPSGATPLARSSVGPQAFRAGSALAVQFHPEVTPAIVARWAMSDPEPVARAGLRMDEMVARTAAEQPRAREAARRLVGAVLAPSSRGAP